MEIEWVDGFEIQTSIENDEIIISANKEGLLSLAKQCIALAEEEAGAHIHYDIWNALSDGSKDMIIEKTK